MTSEINTAGLNENFPVAGVNNDSKGFRDNFLSIKHGLDTAASEITELQNRSGFTGSMGDAGYTGSTIVNGYTGSASEEIGYTGSTGDTGFTGSRGAGYTGSASTIVGYAGSRGFTGSIGFTGSASTVSGPQGPTGFTGSGSAVSGPQGPTGFTGSGSAVSGPQGPTGFTGSAGTGGTGYTGSAGASGGGGGGLVYRTVNFTATANTQYVVDTTEGAITITLPATPSSGDYVTFTAKNLQTNTVTVTDGAMVNFTFDKVVDGAKFYYDGVAWQLISDGTVRSYTNTSIYNQIAIFDDNNSNVIRPSTVEINYSTGEMTIIAPTAPYGGAALTVNAFPGYTGSATDPSSPAIESRGAAYTPSISVTSASGVLDIDCGLGNVFYTTLTESISNLNLNNPRNGQTINVLFKQGIGGGFTMNWGTVSNSLKWPNAAYEPPLSTNAGKRDVFVATYIDIGTDAFWYCTLTNDFTSPA